MTAICRKCQSALHAMDMRKRWRAYALKSRYGISQAQFDAMSAAQEGRCPICGRHPEKLVVDHDHGTGEVRGLICSLCNSAIGKLMDNPHVLRRAAEYLEKTTAYVPLISCEARDYWVYRVTGTIAA